MTRDSAELAEGGQDEHPVLPNTHQRLLENCYKMPDGSPYIRDISDQGSEVISLDEKSAVDYVSYQYYADTGAFPAKKKAKEVVADLRLHAIYDRPVAPVAYRVQSFGDAGVEIKLNNRASVKVTAANIDIGPHYGHFWNSGHELDLPIPDLSDGVSIEPYYEALGIDDVDSQKLMIGTQLNYLYPCGPYPIMVFKGPHGSGKSTISTGFKSLVDPSRIEKISDVTSPRDLFVVAAQNRVLSFDNVSELSGRLYDAHCTIATGAQRAERKLYTNTAMSYVVTENPQVFNGIPNLFHREDFRERSILVEVPLRQHRQSLQQYREALELARPAALGHLLKAMKYALANLESTSTPQGLRMADAARLVSAAEPIFGWERGSFVEAYKRNQKRAILESMSEEPLFRVLQVLLAQEQGVVSGSPTEIHNRLKAAANGVDLGIVDEREWPKGANALSRKLNRMEGTLATLGVSVSQSHIEANRRTTRIVDENFVQ